MCNSVICHRVFGHVNSYVAFGSIIPSSAQTVCQYAGTVRLNRCRDQDYDDMLAVGVSCTTYTSQLGVPLLFNGKEAMTAMYGPMDRNEDVAEARSPETAESAQLLRSRRGQGLCVTNQQHMGTNAPTTAPTTRHLNTMAAFSHPPVRNNKGFPTSALFATVFLCFSRSAALFHVPRKHLGHNEPTTAPYRPIQTYYCSEFWGWRS